MQFVVSKRENSILTNSRTKISRMLQSVAIICRIRNEASASYLLVRHRHISKSKIREMLQRAHKITTNPYITAQLSHIQYVLRRTSREYAFLAVQVV